MFKNELGIFYDANIINSKPKDKDKIFIYKNKLVSIDDNMNVISFEQVKHENLKYRYLFSYGDIAVFLGIGDCENEQFNSCTLRDFLNKDDMENGAIALTSHHLLNWYNGNKFCGRCGNELESHKHERALICPICDNILYPTISPATIVAITNGDEILLTKYAQGDYANYALVAGYVEVGENLEQCIEREVYEEVGLKVKNIKYFDSQPWGISNSVLAGFFAELDGSSKVCLDEYELKEAKWFKRCDIPNNNYNTSSLTWTMIEFFRNQS